MGGDGGVVAGVQELILGSVGFTSVPTGLGVSHMIKEQIRCHDFKLTLISA